MFRILKHNFYTGAVVCILLLIILYMYSTQRNKRQISDEINNHATYNLSQLSLQTAHQQEPVNDGKNIHIPSTHQQKPQGNGNPVHPKDTPLPSVLNVQDPNTVSANSSGCILTKTDPSFHICLWPPNLDLYISKRLLHTGRTEPEITRLLQLALRRFPQAVVIDVGSNIGYFSLLAAAMGHSAIAVEATKANIGKLLQGVKVNGVADKVTVLYNAVAERHRKVSMAVFLPNNQGAIRVQEKADPDQLTVQTIMMDDLIPLVHNRTAIIVMDIEGYECLAIAGATKFLHNVNVPYIVTEWQVLHLDTKKKASPCPTTAIHNMTEYLLQLGYHPHNTGNNHPLDPKNSPAWRAKDVYWRRSDQPVLTRSLI